MVPDYGSLQVGDGCLPEEQRLLPEHDENEHDNIQGNFKAAVFGFSDGLTTNLNLILGIYATISRTYSNEEITRTVILLGMAGLFAGASSMACGEWLSAKAEHDFQHRELQVEAQHLKQITSIEQQHMKKLLESYGLSASTANSVNSDLALLPLSRQVQFHAKFELGIDVDDEDSPLKNALCMWVCFVCGALLPLMPWFLTSSVKLAFAGSIAGSLVGWLGISLFQVRGHYRALPRTFLRQVVVGGLAIGVTVMSNLIFTHVT